MKAHILLSSVAPFLASTVLADFYIYQETAYSVDDGGASTSADGFKFYNGPPSCDDVNNSIFQIEAEDVSGSRSGVRCDNCGTGDIQTIEWNTNMGHFTAYAERGWGMFTTDDVQVGQCNIDQSDDYTCGDPFAEQGKSLLFCSSSYNADSTNAH